MRCFVSSQDGSDRAGVIRALQILGVEALTEYSTEVGGDWGAALRATVEGADFTVIVLPSRKPDPPALLVEIGVALGLGKPVLVVIPRNRRSRPILPGVSHAVLDPHDEGALELHLRTIIETTSATVQSPTPRRPQAQPELSAWLRQRLAELEFEAISGDRIGSRLEDILVQLFDRAGGVSQLASSYRDAGPDLAATFEGDSPFGGVVLVEVKASRSGQFRLEEAIRQLQAHVSARGAQLGLVALWSGKPWSSRGAAVPPGIAVVELHDLANELEERSLAQILADRRNQSVHGLRR